MLLQGLAVALGRGEVDLSRTMEYQSFQQFEAKAGDLDYALRGDKDFILKIQPVGLRRVSVSIESMKFRGMEVHASGYFVHYQDWNEWQDFTPRTATTSQGRHDFTVRRPGVCQGDAPFKTSESVRALVAPLVASWVSDHGEDMDAAEAVSLNNDAAWREADVLDAAEKLSEKQAKFAAAKVAIDAHKEAWDARQANR